MDGYSVEDVTKMLGLTPGRLRAYLRAGFLSPERGERGKLQFSFRDLLLLRTAEGLVAERIAPRRVLRALRKLRERVPESRPLTELQLRADGDRVVVRDGASRWQPESGQVLLSFPDGSPPLVDTPVSAFSSRTASPALARPEIPEVLPNDIPQCPEIAAFQFRPEHRWYYFPEMGVDEVLLFKNHDSAQTGAWRVPHAGLRDPTCSPTRPRLSIEARVLAFFL